MKATHDALNDWGHQILRAYMNGNKSDARDAFRQVPEHRKAFVVMILYTHYDAYRLSKSDVNNFILSVTE